MIKNIAKKSLVLALLAGIGFRCYCSRTRLRNRPARRRRQVRFRPVLAHRLLDPGCCRQGRSRLRMRQGPAAEGSL